MKIMIVTEAWDPQINGVVRTLKMTTRQLTDLGHEVQMLTPDQFFNIPCPTYPEIRLTIASTHKVRKKIDEFKIQDARNFSRSLYSSFCRRAYLQRL